MPCYQIGSYWMKNYWKVLLLMCRVTELEITKMAYYWREGYWIHVTKSLVTQELLLKIRFTERIASNVIDLIAQLIIIFKINKAGHFRPQPKILFIRCIFLANHREMFFFPDIVRQSHPETPMPTYVGDYKGWIYSSRRGHQIRHWFYWSSSSALSRNLFANTLINCIWLPKRHGLYLSLSCAYSQTFFANALISASYSPNDTSWFSLFLVHIPEIYL